MQKIFSRIVPLALLLASTALVAETSLAPGINDHYRNADVERWRGMF